MQSFWADTSDDERRIFQECVEAANAFPDAPIYHYGSYEPRAFQNAAKTHGIHGTAFLDRLININSFIFGKIYFPTSSNRLKDLGAFVGSSWSATDPSGLLSIAWRYRWEDTGEDKYKDMLLSYNHEDCQAVRLLARELQNLAGAAISRPDVDVPSTLKTNTTATGKVIHDTLDRILKSAHLTYIEKQIRLRSSDDTSTNEKGTRRQGNARRTRKLFPIRAGKVVRVPRKRKCSHCPDQNLRRSKRLDEHLLWDLALTKNGCRKIAVKYVGHWAFCPTCRVYFPPPGVKRLKGQRFGRSFRGWTVYMRIALRLPIHVISQVIETLFSEHIASSTVVESVAMIAHEYADSEKLLQKRILNSPVLHADETKINIRGVSHYAWVLTDGKHVVFKLSDTRQISTIEPLLAGYDGVLVSDFYGGYDSLECKQQKCLVHRIRDLNDDLWKNPFNEDYECFVGTIRDLLVPIFEDVNRWGLKSRFLKKHMKLVDRFYSKVIEAPECRSELVETYRKRFKRYRESLFLFLTEDGIPWNNNMAERALRHLSVQQKISGCFMGSGADDYLRLLGICQTCRFQDKPFLQFLLSGEKDLDQFKVRKRRRKTS